MDRIAGRLAERGFVVMNASYRLVPAHRFPAPLHDLQHAVRWLRAAAPRYGVDPQRIGAFGYSAGAHLVTLLGTVNPGTRSTGRTAAPIPACRRWPRAAHPRTCAGLPAARWCRQFLGATFAEDPHLFAAASPVVHASAGDPPMFLYHGALDRIVDPSHSAELKRALERAGVRAELRIVPLLGHIPDVLPRPGYRKRGDGFPRRGSGLALTRGQRECGSGSASTCHLAPTARTSCTG